MQWTGDENFFGAKLPQNVELVSPKWNAIDLEKSFVATHAARFAAGQKDRAESGIH